MPVHVGVNARGTESVAAGEEQLRCVIRGHLQENKHLSCVRLIEYDRSTNNRMELWYE